MCKHIITDICRLNSEVIIKYNVRGVFRDVIDDWHVLGTKVFEKIERVDIKRVPIKQCVRSNLSIHPSGPELSLRERPLMVAFDDLIDVDEMKY